MIGNFLFQLLTYGRRLPLAELFARVDAVDEVTVKRVAKRFLHDKVSICHFGACKAIVLLFKASIVATLCLVALTQVSLFFRILLLRL